MKPYSHNSPRIYDAIPEYNRIEDLIFLAHYKELTLPDNVNNSDATLEMADALFTSILARVALPPQLTKKFTQTIGDRIVEEFQASQDWEYHMRQGNFNDY